MMLSRNKENARNDARCMQAMKAKHGLDGKHQDVDRTLCGRVNQNDRESTYMVWPSLRSRTAEEQNSRNKHHSLQGSSLTVLISRNTRSRFSRARALS